MQNLLTPALVSVIVTVILAPLLFYWLNKREQRRQRRFEIRYEQYQKFLTKLDEIAEGSRTMFAAEFGPLIKRIVPRILGNPSDSDAALIELNEELHNLTSGVHETYSKAKNELNGLRLVCSNQLLPLVEEFISTQDRQFQRSLDLLAQWKTMSPDQVVGVVPPEAEEDAAKTRELQARILEIMRAELSLD